MMQGKRSTAVSAAWTPPLVMMRLRQMVDVTRREERVTSHPAPAGFKCSMPTPPEGRDWEGMNAYRSSAPLLPVPPSDEERLVRDETVQWLRELSPTNRIIALGGAAQHKWSSVQRELKQNTDIGALPMSREGIRRRWFRLLEKLAVEWTRLCRPIDKYSRTMLLLFDMREYLLGVGSSAGRKAPPRTKGHAFVNGEERRMGSITAAVIDQASIKKENMYFRRHEWRADAPVPGRDGVVRKKKKAVAKVAK